MALPRARPGLARRHPGADLLGNHSDVPPHGEGDGTGEELGPSEKPDRGGKDQEGQPWGGWRRVVHRKGARGASYRPVRLAFQHHAYYSRVAPHGTSPGPLWRELTAPRRLNGVAASAHQWAVSIAPCQS